jgi:pilus assembly protein CpaB
MWRRRLPRSSKLLLVAAVACALAAGSIVRSYAARIEATRPFLGPPRPVVVAARPVARGAAIGADDVRLAEVPAAVAPPGALDGVAEAIGRVALTDLAPGEAIASNRLSGGAGGALAALVPPGLRAVTVPLPVVPDGLAAGDRVDVIATYGEGRAYAETVGPALEVLRVGGQDAGGAFGGGTGGGGSLVLLVDPATATRLARASAFAVLSIAVVGAEDG